MAHVVIDELRNTPAGGLYLRLRAWSDRTAMLNGVAPVVASFSFESLSRVGRRATAWDANDVPTAFETFTVDVVSEVRAALGRYWRARVQRGQSWPRDHVDARADLTDADPRGLRQADLTALVGTGMDV